MKKILLILLLFSCYAKAQIGVGKSLSEVKNILSKDSKNVLAFEGIEKGYYMLKYTVEGGMLFFMFEKNICTIEGIGCKLNLLKEFTDQMDSNPDKIKTGSYRWMSRDKKIVTRFVISSDRFTVMNEIND